jgi:cytochrome b5
MPPSVKTFTVAEVAKHNTKKDCWVVVDRNVIDVTKFLDDHPGGVDVIADLAGLDVTDKFEAVGHSAGARETMSEYKIGVLKPGETFKVATKEDIAASRPSVPRPKKPLLSPEVKAFVVSAGIGCLVYWLVSQRKRV